jgi:hypothetical protein
MASTRASARRARLAFSVLPLCTVLAQTACAYTRTTATPVPVSAPAAPNFVARVVSACRATGIGPAVGLHSQVDLIVAIPPATVANAGVIVDVRARLYIRQGTWSPLMATADSFVTGDELEVWHDGMPALESAQSPPGTPAYHATKVVIRRRTDQAGPLTPVDTLVACRYDSK